MTIRKATEKDIAPIAQLYIKTWQHSYKGFLPKHFLNSLSVEYYKKVRKHHQQNQDPAIAHFVAEDNGMVKGFCDVGPNRDPNLEYQCGEVYALYIDPNAMGQGIGALLLKTGQDWLKEHDFTSATVWVIEDNVVGRRFYAERDWQETKTVRQVSNHGISYREVRYLCSF